MTGQNDIRRGSHGILPISHDKSNGACPFEAGTRNQELVGGRGVWWNTYSLSINTSSLPARTAFMRVSWSRSL
jgi:hypothetical protein